MSSLKSAILCVGEISDISRLAIILMIYLANFNRDTNVVKSVGHYFCYGY